MDPVSSLLQGLQKHDKPQTQERRNEDTSVIACAKSVFNTTHDASSCSTSELSQIQPITKTATEAVELEALSSVCWKCIGCQPDTITKGRLYEFKYIGGEDPFPAVEPYDDSIFELEELGYRLVKTDKGDVTLFLPDIKSLQSRWELLRESDPSLPQLKFFPSVGILTHEEFIIAWLENDIIISLETEFVHDITAHAYEIFVLLLKNHLAYRQSKDQFMKRIQARYEKIKAIRDGTCIEKYQITFEEMEFVKPHTDKLMCMLSAMVDSYSAYPNRSCIDFEEKMLTEGAINNRYWKEYFIDTYKKDEPFFKTLWKTFCFDILEEEQTAINCCLKNELKRWGLEVDDNDLDQLTDYLLEQLPSAKRKFYGWLREISETEDFRNNSTELASMFWSTIRILRRTKNVYSYLNAIHEFRCERISCTGELRGIYQNPPTF